MTTTIQIRKKGTITLPVDMRRKYHLDENDPITVVDLGDGIFLSPKRAVLPKLVSELESLRESRGLTLQDLIQGVFDERGD